MDTANFTDRNEPCVLVLQMTEVAGPAADEIDRSDRRIRLHKIQLFLNERGLVLRNLALNDPHDGLARARVASLQ
jgi:hypothetical protein